MKLDRPSVPDVLPLARSYYAKPGNEVGGNLHIVLDDRNVQSNHVRFCMEQAVARGDMDGVELAKMLLQMTKTQRLKLASQINQPVRKA